MKNIRVLALLPTLGQPRHAKRIAMLKEQGLHVEAVAFKRTLAHGRMPDCAVEIIGTLEHGRYYQRLIELARGARKIANKKYRTFDVLYCFGIDMAIVAIMSKARPDQAVIIETGDIRKPQVAPTLFGKIVRTVDRLALKYTDLLVVTAYDFKIEYYRNTIKTNVKSIVIENKVDFSAISVAPPRTNEPFSIGYFGNLRCPHSWDTLEAFAKSNPHAQVLVAGFAANPVDIPERAAKIANVKWHGLYKNPDDLTELYGSVDIVWACYPKPSEHEKNWMWARTNRFYESCYFQKPMITLEGSADAKIVANLNIGTQVEGLSPEVDAKKISSISPDQIEAWTNNIKNIDKNVYMHGMESTLLGNEIMEVVRAKTLPPTARPQG